MLRLLGNLRKEGSFVKNVFITISWNGAIIVIQVLLSPVITRLYEPKQYGVFTIYSSLVANLALLGTLKYSDAIVLTDSKTERYNLLALIFSVLTTLCLLAFTAMMFFRDDITRFLQYTGSPAVFLLIPASVFLTCSIEVMANANIRRKYFTRNGLAIFVNNAVGRFFNIGYAVAIAAKSSGLIVGDFIGKVSCLFIVSWRRTRAEGAAQPHKPRDYVSLTGMRAVARKFKSFPLFYFPSFLLAAFSGHLPLYFFQWQYGSAMVGAYAFAGSLMEMFNRLIPYSFAPVMLQKANELRKTSPALLRTRIYSLFCWMLLAGTCIFAGFALLGPHVFAIAFGSKWQMAGHFSALIAIHSTFNFVAVSLSEIYNVMGRQRFLLVNSMVGLALKALAVGLALYWKSNETEALFIYAILNSVSGILLILGVFIILNHKIWRVTGWLLVSFTALLLALRIGESI